METWPTRSRGLMSSILQGSWALGYLLSALLYATLYQYIGWRGMLWIGVLPALAVVWIRFYVKEPEVWLENQASQKEAKRRNEGAADRDLPPRHDLEHVQRLLVDGQSGFLVYYSIFGLFATYLTKDLHCPRPPVGLAADADQRGDVHRQLLLGLARRHAGPAVGHDHSRRLRIAPDAGLPADDRLHDDRRSPSRCKGACAGAIYGQNPSYLTERFPTEVRATASAFCYHQGAVWAGLVGAGDHLVRDRPAEWGSPNPC